MSFSTTKIKSLKTKINTIKHQIGATKRLIAGGCKQFIVQLMDLECDLAVAEINLDTALNCKAADDEYAFFEIETVPMPVPVSVQEVTNGETAAQQSERVARSANWSWDNYVYSIGDEHLEPLANTAGNTCKEVCDNVYLTGSYRQKEIAFGIQFAVQTGRASGEIVNYLTADKTREVINLAIADFNNIQVRGNVSTWLVKHFYN